MKFLFIILLFIGFQSFGQTAEYVELLNSYYDDTPTLTLDHAREYLNADGAYFLDTRETAEFKISHIENAINIGYDKFNLSSVKNIPKDATILVYCSIGVRSQNIAKKLIKAGYTEVYNIYGGLFNWANNGFEMVDSSSKPTTRIHGYSKDWSKWITKGTIVY